MGRPEDTKHGRCQATAKSTEEQCGRAAVGEHGKCKIHGGSKDSGAPEGNSNAEGNSGGLGAEITHGIYADVNKLYNETFAEEMVAFVDATAADLYERFEGLHGMPTLSQKSRIFEIAMNVAKGVHADNWAEDKPDELKTPSPLVDRESEIVPVGDGETETQVKYSESVPIGTQQRYRREDRQWLKSYGLLEHDPDSKAASALTGGLDLNLSSEDKDVLDETFGGSE
jgi:hypothetical protein